MKKILIVFCGALAAICLINVNLASKPNLTKSTQIVFLKKALADSEGCIPDLPIPSDPGPDVPWPGYPDFPVQF